MPRCSRALRSSRMFIFAHGGQAAAEEPETEAKIVQPITLVCSKRPGRALTQGARPRNMLLGKVGAVQNGPFVHTNRGSAVRVQLLAELQMVMAMASPAGRAVKKTPG